MKSTSRRTGCLTSMHVCYTSFLCFAQSYNLGNFFCFRCPQYSSRWSKYHQPSDKRLKSCWRRCWREKLLNQPTTLGPRQLCLWERRMGQQGSVSTNARWTLSQETMHTRCCMWMTRLTPWQAPNGLGSLEWLLASRSSLGGSSKDSLLYTRWTVWV